MLLRKEFIENLIHKYERYIAPFTFIAGFVIDTLTLKRIDLFLDHLVIIAYIFLAGLAIFIINLHEANRLRYRWVDAAVIFMPVIMQYAFGGLLSAFVIFYTKSASFGKSWIFLLALAVLLIGNEKLRKKYQRLVMQLSIFFTALFSYAIFALPIFIKKIGDSVFLASGVLSIGLLVLFVLFLSYFVSLKIKQNWRVLLFSIGGIYLAFNILYFADIIPPAPLSLKESGIYHSIERINGEYRVSYEPAPSYLFLYETNPVFGWQEGETIYFFSSVFAPLDINLAVFHRWYFYDDAQKRWLQKESIRFPITGGRDGGYRGYSFKTAIVPGKWMVEVVTGEGRVLGREVFQVVKKELAPELNFGIK